MTNESSTITDDAAEQDAATSQQVDVTEPTAVKWHARTTHGQTNFDRYVELFANWNRVPVHGRGKPMTSAGR